MESTKNEVVIVGGGIIGLSCAIAAAKSGAKVKVLEKGIVGFGCSYGNAGWVTPCFAMPLPMPGLLLKSIGWLFDPTSPLYIKPQFSLFMASWMTKFLTSMNEKQATAAIEVLVKISQTTLSEFKLLNEKYTSEFGFEQKGLLMLAQTPGGVNAAVDELKRTERYGVRGKILKPEDVHQTEPALKGDFAGGVHFLDEAHLEPLSAVRVLKKEAESLGVEVIEHCELLDFDFANSRLKGIYTTKGRIEADQFVLAMGAWSKEFAKKVSLSIPILGGKGYSLIFPRLKRQPQIPLMILEKKIAVTPRADSIRVAGTLELVDQDFSVTPTRVKAIYNGALRHLDLPDQARVTEVWRGLRPCTSDGVPMIGRHQQYNNIVFACGHQMLGLQTSLGTGKLVADILQNKTSDLNMKILDPNRF